MCCLLVLNLVSSTLPCIRQPRPRLRVLDVCGSVQVYTQALTGFWPLNSWLILLPLALWLSHFAFRPSYLPQTLPHFTRAPRSPSLAHSHLPGLAPPLFLLTAFSDILASSLRLLPLSPAIGAPLLRPGSSARSPTTPRRVRPSPPTARHA